FRVVRNSDQHANPPHALGLLRPRRERPRGPAADERDEIATLHSITSSASCWSCQGTSRPSALAVFRLMTNSNFVGCWIGSSSGLDAVDVASCETALFGIIVTIGDQAARSRKIGAVKINRRDTVLGRERNDEVPIYHVEYVGHHDQPGPWIARLS